MSAEDLDAAIEQSHLALGDIANGDHERYMALYSDRDDVTLGNPFGPFVRGREAVAEVAGRAASSYRGGKVLGFERVATHVADGLACVVEIERFQTKIAGAETASPISLRVTCLYRQEEGGWRLVHRHADPITAPRAPESVIQR